LHAQGGKEVVASSCCLEFDAEVVDNEDEGDAIGGVPE
jgi:hypothetical protein